MGMLQQIKFWAMFLYIWKLKHHCPYKKRPKFSNLQIMKALQAFNDVYNYPLLLTRDVEAVNFSAASTASASASIL